MTIINVDLLCLAHIQVYAKRISTALAGRVKLRANGSVVATERAPVAFRAADVLLGARRSASRTPLATAGY